MAKTMQLRIKGLLRGAGSVINLWPDTRAHRSARIAPFTCTVYLNGRKHQLDARRDVLQEAAQAIASDWQKVAGDVERAILKLPADVRLHANQRFTAR